MDQETHDAAVRTVIAGLRAHADKYDGSLPIQRALADEHLSLARTISERLSPPAKPEAKLEALPTMARMWFWAAMVDEHLVSSTETTNDIVAFLRSIARGELQIVDERGKGAEAEKSWSPCVSCAPHYSSLRDRFRQKGESNARLDSENGALRRRIVELENDILRSRGPGAWPLNQKGAEAERLAPQFIIHGTATYVGDDPVWIHLNEQRAERFPGER